MALGSTQPLREMSTRLFPGDKGGRCVRLTTLPPSCAVVMKSGNLNFLEPSGPLQACNGTALTFFYIYRDESGTEREAGKTELDVQWQIKCSGLFMRLLSALRCTLCITIRRPKNYAIR